MEDYELDPYEQQLLKVFNSHDRENCGSLDREGLVQLCQTLQLDEHSLDLVKCLLKDKRSRVNFIEFKDALLALLGNIQNNKSSGNEEKLSPDREVSPKFVYGSKKYGRRSRPRNDDIHKIIDEEENKPQNNSVQRSNSNTEVSSKKRKTNYRLQRCTSLPTNNSHLISDESVLVCTEEMLREAWKKLGVSEDGYLNRTELILVCDAIGLHKLADGVIRQLSDKLTVNCEHKISLQELLTILQQDDTWFEVLNPTVPTKDAELDRNKNRQSNDALFPDSRTFHLFTLGPDGNGTINSEALVEMWESIGVHSPKELLHELGFSCRRINIFDLADVLDKQIKGITEATRSEFQSPHVALLQASLILYQSEIKTFKNLLEQMHAEREKLKSHVTDANNRATLLAQEVDDNHSRMEQNTLNQVKLIEQRHADILKDLTIQFTKDKDQLTSINNLLEEKISALESEVNKLKNDLSIAQTYSLNVEKENQNLLLKIAELERDRNTLNGQIDDLESEKQKSSELEQKENKLLMIKLATLEVENAQLKDKNDEMVSEIENLSTQVASMRLKVCSSPTSVNTLDQSMEENVSIICEGVGLGAKRRSDYSPSKGNRLYGIADVSPRLGKMRKFQSKNQDNFEVPFTSSESGFDTEIDFPDSSVSTSSEDDVLRLQSKIAFLEQILKENGIPTPCNEFESLAPNGNAGTDRLIGRIKQLEKIIKNVKDTLKTMIESNNVNCDNLSKVSDKLERSVPDKLEDCVCVSSQTDFINEFEMKVIELEKENNELCDKCDELEQCVELLRNEYEKCEDYWENKVDEERQMYESEQKISSDKLTELILKIREYEDQYADQEVSDGRLPTIQETYYLEKQFTDLEEEYECYKEKAETKLTQKDDQIALLKDKLTELALKQKDTKNATVQVEIDSEKTRILNKMQNLSAFVIENTNRFAEHMLPPTSEISPNWDHQIATNDSSESSKSLPANWSWETKPESSTPSTSCSTPSLDKNSTPCTPCRPRRTKKYNKNMYKKKKEGTSQDSEQRESSESHFHVADQKIVIPLKSFNELNARRIFLEQKLQDFQFCLQQHKFCHERTLQHFWHQFSNEKAELVSKHKYLQDKLDQQVRINKEQLDKLEKNDVLVKQLFLENSYLVATLRRMEQRCNNAPANCASTSV